MTNSITAKSTPHDQFFNENSVHCVYQKIMCIRYNLSENLWYYLITLESGKFWIFSSFSRVWNPKTKQTMASWNLSCCSILLQKTLKVQLQPRWRLQINTSDFCTELIWLRFKRLFWKDCNDNKRFKVKSFLLMKKGEFKQISRAKCLWRKNTLHFFIRTSNGISLERICDDEFNYSSINTAIPIFQWK